MPDAVPSRMVGERFAGRVVKTVSFVDRHALRIVFEDGAEIQVAAYQRGEPGNAHPQRLDTTIIVPEKRAYTVVV